MQKFKPIYIPITLTWILLIMAIATGLCTLKDLGLSSAAAYTSTRSFSIVFFLLILPLSLLLMMFTGFACLGIIVGVWIFYGICVLVARLAKKYFSKESPDNACRFEDSGFSENINNEENGDS